MEYKYTKIDLEKWNRGKLFQSYIDDMRIVMSLTVDIDVTNLIKFSKSHDLKFYPAMIWVVSKVVNEHDEFKYSWDNKGNLIKWDYISPSYTEFLAPVITWGKYELERERYIMPLTMNIHHAVADGFHLSRFFNEVQELINSIS